LYFVEADGSRIALEPIDIERKSCSNCIVMEFWDAEKYVYETGKSTVKAEFLDNNITLQRGGHADVPLLLKHMRGTNSERYVSVRVKPHQGILCTPNQ
jgi:hypothetical protein